MKQYVGFSRDHSGSMSSLRSPAMKDYNDSIEAVKSAASSNQIDTVVSVTSCGIESKVRREIVNSSVNQLQSITHYQTDGMTPLFDSVGELIEIFRAVPDYNDPNVSFLVVAITDGEENASRKWKGTLGDEVRTLQATDRWTFVFRVPRGYRRKLESLGIPSGNIQEWDQTERGLRDSSSQTVLAVSNYYTGRTKGLRSTRSFYTDLSKVAPDTVGALMNDISKEVLEISINGRMEISRVISEKGKGFYQLTKPEKAVQDYKIILVRNKNTRAIYHGAAARQLLNMPTMGTIKVIPGNHGEFDIFIQSTSTNRILMPGTSCLYWANAS